MINFRKKKYLIQNLMPDAIEYLKKQGLRPNIITPEQADSVSRVNSKAMVLVSFIKMSLDIIKFKYRIRNYTIILKINQRYF